MLFFPNVFEFWFIFVAGAVHVRPGFNYSAPNTAAVLVVLLGAKEFQEYALHYARWLDSFTSVEAVRAIWEWLTSPLG